MPYGLSALHRANRSLDGLDPDLHEAARSVVAQASTVLEAWEGAGLFDHVDESRRDEIRSALTALPPAIDAALIATLKSALDRQLAVVVQWKPGMSCELQVWEAIDGTAGHIGILLITPYARDMAKG
jgi:hypothetical protein